ncbi:MAG: PIN domain-containing protein [Candidatus Aminicenantia bacterium]
MKTDEVVFLDTNILVYAVEIDNPLHKKAERVINELNKSNLLSCISPQIIGELYVTITNPRKIKKACSPNEAFDIVRVFWETETFLKIYPKRTTLERTLNLVKQYQIKAMNFYDAQIVATMLDNNVNLIYTVNVKDFEMFEEIKAVNPL